VNAYGNLAASYDRLTNDVDYGAVVDFYFEILEKEKLKPRTAVDLACGTGSVSLLLAKKGQHPQVDLQAEAVVAAAAQHLGK
jgi:ubiquinone/menaquinone biosynthesis C-methylase UbiE